MTRATTPESASSAGSASEPVAPAAPLETTREPTARAMEGVHPLVDGLAARIRRIRQDLPELRPLELDPALEAISGSLDGEQLFIHNELHRSRGLRKLHLETARLGAGLQILHCVFFPDPRYDLPVFGADIVAGRGVVSAAIVDLSPVNGTLPAPLASRMAERPRPPFREIRELPPWGAIFSPHVLFVRPRTPEEEIWFVEEVAATLELLAEASRTTPAEGWDDAATIARWSGQRHYCHQQKQNDKTRRVLEKAFHPDWANTYIETLLFDDPLPPGPPPEP
jgi:phycocyanobilin:ferredoxin oxidoreductase